MARVRKVIPPNPIESLCKWVRDTYPIATTHLDEAASANSNWWLDIHYDERHIAIQWHPGKGFGISIDTHNVLAFEMPSKYIATQGEVENAIRQILG